METINFYYILTNISNLLRLFTNTPPDLHLQKFLLTQGKLFPKAMLPQTHWAWSEILDLIKFRSRLDFKNLHKNYLLSGFVGAKEQMKFV